MGLRRCLDACLEDFERPPPVHVAALVRSLGVVERQELIEVDLHLLDRLVEFRATLNPEVLVEQGAVHPLDITVALGPANLGSAMFDLFQLKEEFEGMVVRSSAILPSVVGQDGLHLYAVLFEEGKDEVVQGLDGGHWDLCGEEPAPCVAGVAVEHGLHVDAADALEGADGEGVHADQLACKIGLDMAITVFRVESLEEPDLVLGELDEVALVLLFKPKEPLMAGKQVVTRPNASDAS